MDGQDAYCSLPAFRRGARCHPAFATRQTAACNKWTSLVRHTDHCTQRRRSTYMGWTHRASCLKTVLSNASKLDEAGLRQVIALTVLPKPEDVPPSHRVANVPEELLCKYHGNDAIKIAHSGAVVYHKPQLRDYASGWSRPWNQWYSSNYAAKSAKKKDDEPTAVPVPVAEE
eukprot:6491269-Amphidinium_carterae.2